jgi:peptidoglycan/LPS O-acetylase OafA/YrhL
MFSKLQEASRSAVMLFFVLSGFVLAYALQNAPMPYLRYAVRRIFRIYPTFAFAILASYALHYYFGSDQPSHSEWLMDVVNIDMSVGILVKHLALWGTVESLKLDCVVWSLVHEMRVSLIFPVILLLVQKYKWRSVFVWGCISVCCNIMALWVTGRVLAGYLDKSVAMSLVDTGYFIVFFAAGACLAVTREHVVRQMAMTSQLVRMSLLTIIVYGLLKSDLSNHTLAGSLGDYLRGMGAVGVITFALTAQSMRDMLDHAVLLWLGRVSYSLYLVHVPIIYVLSQTAGEAWSVMKSTCVVVFASLLVAEVLTRFVELPSNELGKRIAAKIRRAS